MKYNEVINKIKDGCELRYHSDNGKLNISLYDEKEDEITELHHQTATKLLRDHKFNTQTVWMEGSQDGGIIHLKLSDSC